MAEDPELSGLGGVVTPTALARLLGTHADFLTALTDREKLQQTFAGDFQLRYISLLDELRRAHGLLREKDEEIAKLMRADRDLKAEEIKAEVDKARISARAAGAEQLLEVLTLFFRQLPLIATAARRFTTEDESYAEALWQATGALFHRLQANKELFQQILLFAPNELQELAAVLKAYAKHKGYQGDNTP